MLLNSYTLLPLSLGSDLGVTRATKTRSHNEQNSIYKID